MTTLQDTINCIQAVIDLTDWNEIKTPADTVTLIEAKAYLIKSVDKIQKVIERGK
jgi:hypothetical protein